MSSPATLPEALAEIDRLTKLVDVLQECLNDPPSHPGLSSPQERMDHEESARVLRELVDGTDPSKGEEFFPSLVQHLAAALQTKYAVVWTFANDERDRMKSLAVWTGDRFADNFEGPIPGTPCERTVAERGFCAFPARIRQQFPDVQIFARLGVESYFAAPLFGREGQVIGNLVVMDDEPRQLTPSQQTILEVFAARAGAELGRQVAEQEMKRSEAYYRALIEQALDIVTVVSRDGLVRYQSPSLQRIMGWRPEERIGRDAFEYLHPDDQAVGRLVFQAAVQQREAIHRGEFRFRHQDGSWRTLEAVGRATTELQGGLSVIVNMRDVTERKQAEALLQRERRHLVEAQALAHLGSWEWDIESGEARWSDEQYRIFGHEPGSIKVTYDTYLTAVHPDDQDAALAAVNATLVDGKPYDTESRIIRPNGEVRIINCRGTVERDAAGHPVRMESTVLDITEQKRMEAALRVSEERWQLAARGSNDGIWDWNIRTGDVFFSARWKAMRGFEEHELTATLDEWRSRIHPDDLERVLQRLDACLAKESSEFCEEYRVLRKNGSYMWVLDRGLALWDDQGQPVRMAGSESDITERKLAESALRQSEERYRLLVDHSPSGVFVCSGGETLYVNQAACRILGASSPEDILLRPAFDLIHPDDRATAEERLRRLLETGEAVSRMELRYLAFDGRVLDVEVNGGLVIWNGKPAVQGIFIDITERKKAEASLKEMNIALAQAMPGIARIDEQGCYSEVNAGYAQMLGCAPVDLLGQSWESTVHPEDLPKAYQAYERMLAEGKGEFEARAVRKDGSTFFKQVLIVKGLNSSDPGHHCFMRDITDRKQAEEALRASEELFSKAFRSSPDPMVLVDLDTGRWLEVNDACVAGLGYGREDLVGRQSEEIGLWIKPDDRRRCFEEVARAGSIRNFESLFRMASGEIRDCLISAERIEYHGKRCMVVLTKDITERTRMERALRESEERFRAVFENAAIGIVLGSHRQGNGIEQVNPALCRLTGYSQIELQQLGMRGLTHPDDVPRSVELVERLIEGQSTSGTLEKRYIKKSGEIMWALTSVSSLRDQEGRYASSIALVQDITERRRAEEALIRSRDLLRSFVEHTPAAVAMLDKDLRYLAVSRRWLLDYRLGDQDLTGRRHYDIFPEIHSMEEWREVHRRCLAGAVERREEDRFVRLDGTEEWLRWEVRPWEEANGEIGGIIMFTEVITERKRTQKALQLFRSLIDHTMDGIEVIDPETGRFLEVNEQACVMHGFTSEEYQTLTVPDLVPGMTLQDWTIRTESLRRTGCCVTETMHRRKDGSVFPVEVNCTYVRLDREYFLAVVRDITERKRAEEALRQTERMLRASRDRFEAAVQGANDGIWDWDLNTNEVYFSKRWKDMLGYEDHELANTYSEWESRLHPEDRPFVLSSLKQYLESQADSYDVEFRMQQKGGDYRWIHARGKAVRDAEGRTYRMAGSHTDIATRKQTETALRESEERFAKAFRSSPNPIGITDVKTGRCIDVNDACLDLFGFSREEVVGQTTLLLGIWPEEADRITLLAQLHERGAVRNCEFSFRTKAGQRKYILVSSDLIELNGHLSMITVGSDITERKEAEEALRISEDRYARATAIGRVGVWELDVKTARYVGDANLKAMIGYGPEELSTDPHAWLALVHSEDQPIAMDAWHRVVEGETDQCAYQIRMHKKDGTIIWIDVRGHAVRDEQGQVIKLIGASTDITERKQSQDALDALVRGTSAVTGHEFFPAFSRELAAALGVKYAGVVDTVKDHANRVRIRTMWAGTEWVTPFEYDVTGTPCEIVMRDGMVCIPFNVQAEFPHDADLGKFEVESYLGMALRNRNGEALGHVFVMDHRPLADSKQATAVLQIFAARAAAELERLKSDEALRKSERELRTVLDALPIGVWFTDQAGKPVLSNPASQRIWAGVQEVECGVLPGSGRWRESVEQSQEPHRWALSRVLTKGESALNEIFELECADGARKTILNSAVPVRGEDGGVLGALVLNEDITERVQAEQAVRQNHAILSAIMDASIDVVYVKDLEGKYVHMNRAGARILGMSIDEVVGWDDTALWGGELATSCRASDHHVIESGQTITIEEKDTSSGKAIHYLTTKAPYRDADGRIIGVIGVSRDITERKEGELEREQRYAESQAIFGMTLALSRASTVEEIYQQALDGVQQALTCDRASILLFDHQHVMRFQAWRGISEAYRSAVDGHSPWTYDTTDPSPIVIGNVSTDPTIDAYRSIFLNEGIHGMAFIPLISPEGLLGKFMLYYDKAHEFTEHEIAVAQTIAGHVAYVIQRARAEEALRLSEERFAKAFRASLHPVVIAELESGLVIEANDSAYQLFGYTKEDVVGRTTLQIGLWPSAEDRARFVDLLKREGSVRNLEVRLRMKSGAFRQCLLSSELIELDGTQCMVTVGNDITDRKRAEEELRRSHAFLRQVIDIDPNFIFAKDREGRFQLVNKAVADAYGTTVDDLTGRTDADFNPNHEEVEFFRTKDLEVMDSLQERFIPEEVITDVRGKTRWLQTVKRPIMDEAGCATMVLGAATDITERKQMEEELRQRERALRAALEERERISQDLHDGILQSLYAMGLSLETCRPLLRKLRAKTIADTLDRVVRQLNEVMSEVRAFIAGLETELWSKQDVSSAIRTMVQALSQPYEQRCRVLIHPSAAEALTPEQGMHLFGIIKEALSNSLRHARATSTSVSLRQVNQGVRLTISDNGVGFNPARAAGVGHGLANMASRASRMSGTLSIRSKAKEGTRVVLDLPKEMLHA